MEDRWISETCSVLISPLRRWWAWRRCLGSAAPILATSPTVIDRPSRAPARRPATSRATSTSALQRALRATAPRPPSTATPPTTRGRSAPAWPRCRPPPTLESIPPTGGTARSAVPVDNSAGSTNCRRASTRFASPPTSRSAASLRMSAYWAMLVSKVSEPVRRPVSSHATSPRRRFSARRRPRRLWQRPATASTTTATVYPTTGSSVRR